MKNALTAISCSVLLAVGANAQDLQGEYFFDSDPGVGNGIPITVPAGPSPTVNGSLDISGLSPGVHFWYARTKQNGVWGFYGERRLFYIWDPTSNPAPVPTDIEAAEYFFDQDPGVGNGTGLAVTPAGSLTENPVIDITGLTPGIHLWYVRTKQNGVWGFYGERRLFYIWDPTSNPAPVPTDIEAAEYFFDQDPGVGNGTALAVTPAGSLTENPVIDITGLTTGIHFWYVRTKQDGVWGFYGERKLFYLWDPTSIPAPTPTDIEAAEYFFDQDPGVGNGTALAVTPGGSVNESPVIDITGLTTGTHLWYVRTKQNGTWGFYGESKLFFIWDPADLPGAPTDIEAAEYYIDNDPGVGNGTPLTITPGPSPFANALIDVSGYAPGTHYWNVRVKQNGVWGHYGEQQAFNICVEDPDPAITFTPSGSCTNGTFTVDVSMPATWAGDPFRVFNSVNAEEDTLVAGETATFGPFVTGTEILITAGSSLDPTGCTKQYRATLSCWYEDTDNDGFGDPFSSVVAETQPAGYVADDSDNCPADVNKIDPLICGCGIADIPTTWYEDLDGDGFGDASVSQPGYTCIQPSGFVLDNTDNCPSEFGLISDACDDGNIYTVNDTIDGSCTCIGTPSTVVAAKVFLEGPYDSMTGLMHDSLRVNSLLPLMDPYPALGYTHTGPGNDGVVQPSVFNLTGNDAIVDWVILELRNSVSPTTIVASRSALLQRDGDIVELDGTSPIDIEVIGGDLFVSVLHRNHLGVMTQASLPLSPAQTAVDFTSSMLSTFGAEARKSIGGSFPAELLWMGDVSFNGTLKYTGSGNDRDLILVEIGGSVPTNTVTGYLGADTNMDGTVKYIGASNDRDPILVNIGGSVPTNIRDEQLP
jgi:hypothetical protein